MNAMSCCGGPAAHRDTGGAVAGVSGAWARVEARLARFGAVWLIGSAGLPILYPVPEDGGAAVPAEPSPLVAPAILSFTAAPDAILPGDVTVLRWKTSGAVLLRLDPGVGLVQGTAKTLRPAETTRFKLTATSAAGVMVSAEATVRVARGPIVAEFGVPPAPRRVVTPTMFGISYSVPGFGTIWSGSHYRGRFIRAAADRDFALMASLHVETVKLYYGPDSGLVYLKDGGARLRTAANDPDWPYYDDAVAFAPEIFRRATDLGMRPTLCFMTNEIYTTGPNGMYYNGGPTWYEYAYLHGPGPARMARDIAAWEKGLVDALLASPVCDQIYYINLATELGYAHIGAEGVTISDAQVDGLPQAVKVPAARRAMDALTGQINPATGHFIYDVADIRLAARARLRRTPLAITEVHDYPDLYKDSPGATLPGIVSPALVESTTRASVVT